MNITRLAPGRHALVELTELRSLLPPHSTDERLRLEQQILRDGYIRNPLVCFRHDGQLCLIDGYARYDIAQQHGLDFPVDIVPLASLNQAIAWAADAHLGRRNLDPARQSELIAMTANFEQALRPRVSPPARLNVVHPPASRFPKGDVRVLLNQAAWLEGQPLDVDRFGAPIPRHIQYAFNADYMFATLLNKLAEMKHLIDRATKTLAGYWLSRLGVDLRAEELIALCREAEAFCVCPVCRGESGKTNECEDCDNLGWMPRWVWDQLTPAQRVQLRSKLRKNR